MTLSVPENVTAHNLSKGTSVTNGKIQIYGGDTFYLSADLLLTGSYASGNLYGSVGKTSENTGADNRKFQAGYRCI